MEQLHLLLEQLREAYIERGCCVNRYLQSGLTKAQVVEATARLGFSIPDEIIQLYMWRNGQSDNAEGEPDAFCFRDNTFISLERALGEYETYQKFYGQYSSSEKDGFDLNLSFPFATFNGAWYVIVCGPHKLTAFLA